ncbi:adenylate/guanylate cyclase domain-containing protein [Nocardioides marmorisolisilvae]|uniref:Adenylate/guanylate cyclase domain-containing protein n=1 Tax=Nocardioides marmorisolisilvae TaxID=1542737 RepID=A0A3N0DX14_9ACTN|nr:adenylate/guanylate cyclase domain-containing protein [Nocardioides marmorisolisilvae]RNL80091.1 adenylate/guanylate cyclase domain-containing protein [Nocardioides marmorisolisilvae]
MLALVLGIALLLVSAALGWALFQLRATRAELAEANRRVPPPFAGGSSPRAVRTASAVRSVVEAVARVREQGVGGMLVSTLEDFNRWAADQRAAIGRVAGEDGTVTIFFSDIENSTQLNTQLGDARWLKVLSAHDRLVETYVDKYRGLIVKSFGDGHMVVFSTPTLAISASLDIQRALSANWNRSRELRRTPIRVRIGLHTGTAIERDGDYFGQNVALAARVAGQAQGGEILVTAEIAEALEEEFDFPPAGAVELKGFEGPQELFHVGTGR